MATNYFLIRAPYPALASSMMLPSPRMGNNQGLNAEVTVIRMMDGSRRSIIKKSGNKSRHRWTFVLSRDKMEEVEDFILRYRGETFQVIWRGREVVGKVNLNPVEFSGEGRANGWPGDEAYETTIEMTEV